MGGNRTARQDEQVEFKCVTSGWFPKHTVGWSLNGKAATSSLYNTTVVEAGDFYNSTSVLNFQAVSNTTVECWATLPTLTTAISSSVSLVVGKKQLKFFSMYCINTLPGLFYMSNIKYTKGRTLKSIKR